MPPQILLYVYLDNLEANSLTFYYNYKREQSTLAHECTCKVQFLQKLCDHLLLKYENSPTSNKCIPWLTLKNNFIETY